MEQRVSFITLAVADLARSRAFYVDGLGWRPIFLMNIFKAYSTKFLKTRLS